MVGTAVGNGAAHKRGFFALLGELFSNGRPPEPDPASLPRPLTLGESIGRQIVGHVDDRSVVVAHANDLLDLIRTLDDMGLRTGAIVQTSNAGSAGHILVHGNVQGQDQVVGWIAEARTEKEPSTDSGRFQYRTPKPTSEATVVLTDPQYLGAARTNPDSNSWSDPSLARLLSIAARVNFEVSGIKMGYGTGERAFINLQCGPNGEVGRGQISACRDAKGSRFYELTVHVGPRKNVDAEDFE